MQLLYAINIFAYGKETLIHRSGNKGWLVWNRGIISIKLPQREALIYKLFKWMLLFEETLQNNHFELGKNGHRVWKTQICSDFNPDQHPNLIALSLTFDERDTRVEVSVCLLSLKHLPRVFFYTYRHFRCETNLPKCWSLLRLPQREALFIALKN